MAKKPTSISALFAQPGSEAPPDDAVNRAPALAESPAPPQETEVVAEVSPKAAEPAIAPEKVAKPSRAKKPAPAAKAEEGEEPKRKRPWHAPGMDEVKQQNYGMPLRVGSKLAWLKSNGRIEDYKTFVAQVIEAEADRLIAEAEKEGY
jgi:hypothetical protein